MLNHQNIPKSKLPPILIANDNTASGASRSRRLTVISRSTALTAMKEEIPSVAHLLRPLGVQVKRARSLGSLMHHILAIGQLVD